MPEPPSLDSGADSSGPAVWSMPWRLDASRPVLALSPPGNPSKQYSLFRSSRFLLERRNFKALTRVKITVTLFSVKSERSVARAFIVWQWWESFPGRLSQIDKNTWTLQISNHFLFLKHRDKSWWIWAFRPSEKAPSHNEQMPQSLDRVGLFTHFACRQTISVTGLILSWGAKGTCGLVPFPPWSIHKVNSKLASQRGLLSPLF